MRILKSFGLSFEKGLLFFSGGCMLQKVFVRSGGLYLLLEGLGCGDPKAQTLGAGLRVGG